MINSKFASLETQAFKQSAEESICFAAASLNQIVITNPDLVNQAARELGANGSTRLGSLALTASKSHVELARSFANKWNISFERALLLICLAEEMNGHRHLIVDKSGNLVSLDPSTGEIIAGGRMDWILATRQKISGGSLYPRELVGAEGLNLILRSPNVSGNLISIVWDEVNQSRHLLTILKVEGNRVYFLDSINTQNRYFKLLFQTARAESGNIWSVSLDELVNSGRIRYIIAQPGLHPGGVMSATNLVAAPKMADGLEYFVYSEFLKSRRDNKEKATEYLKEKKKNLKPYSIKPETFSE